MACTHGGFMDNRMFDAQLGPLIDSGYQVLTWDVPGHGSTEPANRDPSAVDLAKDLLSIIDTLKPPGRVCLVGQSLGGIVAQHVLLTAPERVSGLVVIGAPCVTLASRRLNLMMAVLWRVSGAVTGLLPESVIRRQLVEGTAVDPTVQGYVRAVTARVTKRQFRWLVDISLRAGRRLPGYRIDQPVLIARGARDGSGAGKLTARTAPHWTHRDPHARYELVPDAGHQTNQDNPETFNRILLDFLAELDDWW
ncbi:alpha/beta fold hydrolase [Tamaricihabitans halophyticus]|uniref:alpha/beta fold hydrolase n=1 Tax=Tamaricihabitans halophyticus TaxID=1262583 RepID=UPI0024371C49|nr:alpha/beta hydrolase [Tamaricihabitans halophyticus]